MEFEEFARRFRERAASRMLDFELALEKAREEAERSSPHSAGRAAGPRDRGPRERATASESWDGAEYHTIPNGEQGPEHARRRGGPVRGVLRG